MDISGIIKNLHPLEIKVLLKYTQKDELTSARLQKELDYKEGHANQAFSWLGGKELVKEQITEDVNAIFAGEREVIRVNFGQFIIQ